MHSLIINQATILMPTKATPTILIVNDDGIHAQGIKALVQAVQHLGKVVVVAPDKGQSAMGHAITINNPLRLEQVHVFSNVLSYQCSGTPADCVKLAVDKVLHEKPTICLSGINHGANHSINVIYSGTMSAAMEAAIEGIPSIGFSLLDYAAEADFEQAATYVTSITQKVLTLKSKLPILLNVNIPKTSTQKIKGIKLCRQANAKYVEEFAERLDPMQKKYYWLTGKFVNFDKGKDTDVWALAHNYVSIVPVQFDFTHYALKAQLETQWL